MTKHFPPRHQYPKTQPRRAAIAAALLVAIGASVGLTAVASPKRAHHHAAQRSGKMLSVVVNEANFRKGPSLRHDIAFSAIRNYPVRLLKRSKDWLLVEDFEGEQAWVKAKLLAPEPAVIIRVEHANVRAKPTTRAAVVHKAERGEVFQVIGGKGKWIELASDDNLKGWLRQDLAWGAKRKR